MNDAEEEPFVSGTGEVGLVRAEDFEWKETFTFDSGQSIPGFTLRYETYGRLNAAGDNAILICHALSGDHHCAGIHSLEDRKPGWWNKMIGPGKPIDTQRFFVVCSNCLGGCQGSTGPSSTNPKTGRAYALDFPFVTIRDMVRAQRRLIDYLGISSLFAVIGGSMGGMQVLQWGIEYPDRVRQLIALATTARQNAQAIAFNQVGRQAIIQDEGWKDGNYPTGEGPKVGLSIARMMAHITYLSDKGMEKKFGRRPKKLDMDSARSGLDIKFEVESYLQYQGKSFLNRFDARTYVYFTRALDYFDLPGQFGSLEEAFAGLKARCLVVGFTSDWLFPPDQNRKVVLAMLNRRKDASYAEIPMDFGHDSFLIDAPDLFQLVRSYLA